ncbi:MAG TPA: hypothetical protein VFV39_09760 [Limnobacter sp.]|nr:hypothetical protein [Limnobacter sp.]
MRRFVDLTAKSNCAEAPGDRIESVQNTWTKALRTDHGPQRDALICQLAETVDELAMLYPNDSKTQLWRGIVLCGYAKTVGGLVCLKLLQTAKTSFEKAIALNPKNGPAHLYLGLLYQRAPEAPFGFGDETRARALLEQGLALTLSGTNAAQATQGGGLSSKAL